MNIFTKLNFKYLFDSHAHLNGYTDEEIKEIISHCKVNEIKSIFNMSLCIDSSLESVELSKNYPEMIFSFVGIDPEVYIPNKNISEIFTITPDQYISDLSNIINKNKSIVFGIGEIGIDNYWLHKMQLDSLTILKSLSLQKQLFISQLELAEYLDLPVSLHSRGAEQDCIEIVKNFKCAGIFHSFTGNYEQAKKILDLGWGIGVNGIITYKNAENIKKVFKKILGKIPTDVDADWFYQKGVFFESDSPYLTPAIMKNKKNYPYNIKITFNFLKNLLQ